MTKKEEERAESQARLRELVREGDTLWITTEYTSTGGRFLRVFFPVSRGDMDNLTGTIADACGYAGRDRDGGRWWLHMGFYGYSAADKIAHDVGRVIGGHVECREF